MFGNEMQYEPNEDGGQAVVAQFKGDELDGECGADVRAQNRGDRLRQCHESGIDKADEKHDRGTTLNESANDGAESQPRQSVAGGFAKERSHAIAHGGGESVAHGAHAKDEKGESAQQSKDQ